MSLTDYTLDTPLDPPTETGCTITNGRQTWFNCHVNHDGTKFAYGVQVTDKYTIVRTFGEAKTTDEMRVIGKRGNDIRRQAIRASQDPPARLAMALGMDVKEVRLARK